jgi:serine/threonine-protein kinase
MRGGTRVTDDDQKPSGKTSATFEALLRAVDVETRPPRARAAPADLIGKTLGHYRVVARLGQGGMGVVYRAEDTRLGREVALKVLPEAVAGDDERRRRFIREARAAAIVDHANIATVYDVGEAEGCVYLAMELVVGTTLRDRLAAGPLEAPEATHVARQIALGLSRAHQRGIVHRDLKPDNVMLTRDGGVKILDFGLAKLREPVSSDRELSSQDTQTQEGRVLGTPGYMSPEQATGRAVDARTDVYALGVVIHEMLTGDLPGPYSDSKAKGAAAAGLASIVSRCVARSPEMRWGDAGEVVLALDALARPASPASRSSRGPRVLFSLAAVGALAALGVIGATALRAAPPPPLPSSAAPPPAAPAPRGTTLADLPVPATTVPEARSEYAAGIQFMRDDALESARVRFEHAAALDPTMAMAHVRAAMTALSTGDPEETRARFTKAASFRATLDDRNRTLLEALEPLAGRARPDEPETLRRLEAAHARFPDDEEFLLQLAYMTVGDPARCVPAATRATELDPSDAAAWEALGRSLALAGRLDEGRSALERCAAVSVESSDCFFWLGLLDGQQGRCDDMERESRREADVDPRFGNVNLALAMVALGRPESVVRETEGRALATYPPERARIQKALVDASLASLAGRFDLAATALDEEARALDASPSARVFFDRAWDLATGRIESRLEIGDDAGARAAAQEFASRVETLTRRGSQTYFGDAWWSIARVAGAPLEPARSAWVSAKLDASAPGSATWVEAWASPAVTRDDATAAMGALARDPRLALPRGGEDMWLDHDADALAGRVLLLAGKPAEALPLLRRASNDCFALDWPYQHMHAVLDLGRALEQTGDTAGACAAYARVLAKWGTAKPRSITADAAREGVRRLRCPR